MKFLYIIPILLISTKCLSQKIINILDFHNDGPDNNMQFQSAINSLKSNENLLIPENVSLVVSKNIEIKDKNNIKIFGGGIIKYIGSAPPGKDLGLRFVGNCENVVIDGINF